jgi:FkbM family methyltransferase
LRRATRLLRELRLVRRAFRNWPTVALAGLLWRHLALPPRELTLVTRRGTSFLAPLGPRAGALHPALQIFAFGAYEANWDLGPTPHVIDVGAHVGAFVLWLVERHPDLTGVCFEPDPAAFAYLERNLAGLDVSRQPRAVAGHGGTSTLARPIPGGGVSALGDADDADANAVPVSVVSFDDVMADIDRPVALVKLDCEGSEYGIVLDSASAAWEQVRRAVIEYHPVPGRRPTDLVDRLTSLSFALVREQPAGDGEGTYWFSR